MSDAGRLLAVLGLVLGNAIFVAAEYALVTARRGRLEERAERGSRSARRALRLLDDPVRFIGAIQVGITVFGIALGAVGEPLFSRFFDFLPRGVAFVISFIVLTYLSVALGELVPKALALQKAERIALVFAVPLDVMARAMTPLVWLLQSTANVVLRAFRIKPAPAGMIAFTREDIRQSVAAAEDVGEIETAEEEMLYKVFDFAEKEAADVMVPRPEMTAISIEMAPEEALRAVLDSPYTRYPVYRESVDDICGILHVRDLVSALHDSAIADVELSELLRPAYVVPETKDLGALLAEFRKTSQHMAIVVDEYGSTMGIVTLEDLVEEIVGDIEDEFDLPDESVERVDETTIRIDGTFTIDDFNEEFKQSVEHEDYHTIGGFIFDRLGRAAEPGDEVRENGLRLTVLEIEGSRIGRIEVEFLPTEPHQEPAPERGEVA
ncbi:MAG: HlyC/CorC family transporter [Actinobacteria bacterium]|nr:HlyC/CorC family transporter [Actinomycetota bacterium]